MGDARRCLCALTAPEDVGSRDRADLRPDDVPIGFGSSGDLAYLHHLIQIAKMEMETLDTWALVKDGLEVEYYAYRLTRGD